MKYNVKQAVSGIQGNLDQANQNALVNRGLGNLFKGIASRADLKVKSGQLGSLGEGLTEQLKYFTSIASDPSADPLKVQMANDKIQQIKLLASTMNVNNVDKFPDLYKNIVGDDNLSAIDLNMRKLENALKVANIGANARIKASENMSLNSLLKQQNEAEQLGLIGEYMNLQGYSPSNNSPYANALLEGLGMSFDPYATDYYQMGR